MTPLQAQRGNQVTRSVINCDYPRRARDSLSLCTYGILPSYLLVGSCLPFSGILRKESLATPVAFQGTSSSLLSEIP